LNRKIARIPDIAKNPGGTEIAFWLNLQNRKNPQIRNRKNPQKSGIENPKYGIQGQIPKSHVIPIIPFGG
jgi:hypothetical protein